MLKAGVVAARPVDEPWDLGELYEELSTAERLAGYEMSRRFYEIGSFGGLRPSTTLHKVLPDPKARPPAEPPPRPLSAFRAPINTVHFGQAELLRITPNDTILEPDITRVRPQTSDDTHPPIFDGRGSNSQPRTGARCIFREASLTAFQP